MSNREYDVALIGTNFGGFDPRSHKGRAALADALEAMADGGALGVRLAIDLGREAMFAATHNNTKELFTAYEGEVWGLDVSDDLVSLREWTL